jgi:hypothetical protein
MSPEFANKKEFATLQPGSAYYLYGLKDLSWVINNVLPATNFLYDGDGGRVRKGLTPQLVPGGEGSVPEQWTTYIGSLFEISEGIVPERGLSRTTTKHIFAGANRILIPGTQYLIR